jgi:membrane glycosyltransferase
MDAVTRRELRALPDEAPLAMPVQSLRDAHPGPPAAATRPTAVGLRRAWVILGTMAMTAYAAYEMYLVLQVAGLTVLEHAVLALFVALFAWVAYSFTTAVAGFVVALIGSARPLDIAAHGPLPTLGARTALLLPIYNEAPARVMARLQTVYESVAETGTLDHFDFFILSDTTKPDIWIAEEAAFLALHARTGDEQRIFYRHRRRNEGRKAGNIAEWLKRFGGRYESFVVLDADSLMTGDTLVRLAGAMEQHPRVGLIQTLPLIVNARTLFARLQQFAHRLYGPAIAQGIAWWHGADGNYWGHNAIIRTRAFAEAAGLPTLPGRKPIGGDIMSHDFVEAALMRRAGWAVHMAPTLGGSYEECPPSLTDYIARDRRWCQGNLQHLGVLPARGLHWVSRLHLLTGIGSYITAPLWLIFLLTGIVIALQAQFIRPEYFPSRFALFPQWPAQDPVRAAYVFVGTMGLLLVPKLFGFVVMLVRGEARRSFGALGAFFGMLVETLISGLMAPVMMLAQSSTVMSTLIGRDAGWNVQRRDDGSLPWREVIRRYAWHTAFGVLLAAAAYAVSVALFLWMTPVILGLLLAVPLAGLTATDRLGQAFRRAGLLVVPEERAEPAVLARANALAEEMERELPEAGALARLMSDAGLAEAHRQMLSERPRRRGEVDTELVIGLARLEQAERAEDVGLLSERELGAVLADPRGFARLCEVAGRPDGFVVSSDAPRSGAKSL